MAAATLSSPAPTWRDRVWYSRTWRVVALATLLAVLALDHWSAGWGALATPGPDQAAVEELDEVTSVSAELGVPADAVRQLGSRVEFVQDRKSVV
jgi:hypothetical protein